MAKYFLNLLKMFWQKYKSLDVWGFLWSNSTLMRAWWIVGPTLYSTVNINQWVYYISNDNEVD